jgi:hypothetical protein
MACRVEIIPEAYFRPRSRATTIRVNGGRNEHAITPIGARFQPPFMQSRLSVPGPHSMELSSQ